LNAVAVAVATSPVVRDPFADHLLTVENSALIVNDYQPTQVGAVRSMDQELGQGEEAMAEDEARLALEAALPSGWVLDAVRPVSRSQWAVEASVSGEEREAYVSIRAESFRAAVGAVASCEVVSALVDRLPLDAAVEVYIGKQQPAQPSRAAQAGAASPMASDTPAVGSHAENRVGPARIGLQADPLFDDFREDRRAWIALTRSSAAKPTQTMGDPS
jgi:hypothetical protein